MSKILVVEDDIASQMLMTDILEKYGYTAVVATDGLEAISLAEKKKNQIWQLWILCSPPLMAIRYASVCDVCHSAENFRSSY